MSAQTQEEVITSALWHADRPENNAARILSALSAAGWVVEHGWQPIETAPMGRLRWPDYLQLLLPDGGVSAGHWDEDSHARRPRPMWAMEKGLILGRMWQRENQPTHWRILTRPLPAAPEAPR